MPTYEYRCRQCRRKSSLFVLSYRESVSDVCPHCGSGDLMRIMSRFATVRSTEARLESLGDPTKLSDLDETDPASAGRWMKRMGREFGDDLGEDFEGAVEEAMADEERPSQTESDGL